jgi:hypothetical protein
MRTGKLVRGSDLYKKQKGISFEQMYNIGSITNITQKQTYFVYKNITSAPIVFMACIVL